jgi:DNA-directed RNA polymerase specialized sigma24 family protein
MDAERWFATEWPVVSVRLGRGLARHGVPPCDRDDVVQETALRLYRAWDTIDTERGVEAFARTVALNVWRDAVRRPVHHGEVLGDVPEVACGDVVERTTLARMELRRVRRALTRLRPAEQALLHEAIAAEVGADEGALAPAAVRMARMRARRQLVAVLRTASAWTGGVTAAARALRSHRAAITATAAAAVLALGVLHPQGAPAPRVVRFGSGAGDAANRRAVVAAPGTALVRTAARADAPTRVAPRPAVARTTPEPAHVDLTVAEVDVLVAVDMDGFRAQVRDRDGGVPVCAQTPLGPLDRRVDC